jgi:hypothetical protein
MWTRENRDLYEHKGARYPSYLRDAEWALIAPLIPLAKRGGLRREVDVREVMNGMPPGGSRWSNAPRKPRVSRSSRDAGSPNVPSPGSITAGA